MQCQVQSYFPHAAPLKVLGSPAQNAVDWGAYVVEMYFLTVWGLQVQGQGVSFWQLLCACTTVPLKPALFD